MRSVFLRPRTPRIKLTFLRGTPKISATNKSKAALALPSSAGAAIRILTASPCTPATSLRFAPGLA